MKQLVAGKSQLHVGKGKYFVNCLVQLQVLESLGSSYSAMNISFLSLLHCILSPPPIKEVVSIIMNICCASFVNCLVSEYNVCVREAKHEASI